MEHNICSNPISRDLRQQVVKQKTGLTTGTSPFQLTPAPGHLGHGIGRHPHSSQRTLLSIIGSLVSGTQHLFQSICDRSVTAGTRTPKPFLTRGLVPFDQFWFTLVLNRPDSSMVLKGDTTSRHCNIPRIFDNRIPG